MWVSFAQPPQLAFTARPEVAGRMLRSAALLGRVSSWLQAKLSRALVQVS
jgi:hypothetical protein